CWRAASNRASLSASLSRVMASASESCSKGQNGILRYAGGEGAVRHSLTLWRAGPILAFGGAYRSNAADAAGADGAAQRHERGTAFRRRWAEQRVSQKR